MKYYEVIVYSYNNKKKVTILKTTCQSSSVKFGVHVTQHIIISFFFGGDRGSFFHTLFMYLFIYYLSSHTKQQEILYSWLIFGHNALSSASCHLHATIHPSAVYSTVSCIDFRATIQNKCLPYHAYELYNFFS